MTNKTDKKVLSLADRLTVDDKFTIKELEERIENMKADKEKKCKVAKEQLLDMLEVTVDKYRTVTGTAEALRTLRFVAGDDDVNPCWANKLAHDLAKEAEYMHKKAKELNYAEMDQLCDSFYCKDFFVDGKDVSADIYYMSREMMRVDLCRNVGGAAEDMVSFIKRVQEEIDSTGEELKAMKAKEK